MKNKKLLSFLLAALMAFSFTLCGCFDSDAAKKSADVFCSLVFKSETENLAKIGVTEDKKDELVDTYRSQIKGQLRDNVSTWGGNVTESQLDDITNAVLDTLSKITFETKQISKDKDNAEVEISTTHFDLRKADEQAVIAALDEIDNMNFTSDYEEDKKLTEVYLNKLPEMIRNSEISTEKSTNTFKFKKEDKYWLPEDEENFGYMVAMQATNKDNLNLSKDETRITTEEAAEIFWNLSTKADVSGFEKLGYSNEFGDRLVKYLNKKIVKEMKDQLGSTGAPLSDEDIQKMITAYINVLSKNEAQFEEVSKTDDTATVKITSTVIDMTSVCNAAIDKTTNDAIASGTVDTQKIMEAYCVNFIDAMNNVQPIKDPLNQTTVQFVKTADIWVPLNTDIFTDSVTSMGIK